MRRRTLLAAVAFVPLAATLGGCSSLQPGGGLFDERLEGRFSEVSEMDGRRESQSGSFALSRSGSRTVLELGHPLAGILARVTVEPSRTTLETHDGQKFESTSPERLMQDQLGFTFPVTELARWLDGAQEPSPEASAPWSIEFLERSAGGLPKVVRIRREESSVAPSVRITIAIDRRTRN
ncbi:MAG: outer membrane lipoprotein LolB [Sutterellaceae bacterium]|nr:outer membrane lipoprotein LolB [Sutterellaceae bacterium]MDD7441078.1 outer membrane lipoprotein LolB [Sutterellaceae bacterium]MDY2868935.1 outer membrane lipoprotein LolB [Mesosutterella sp.]